MKGISLAAGFALMGIACSGAAAAPDGGWDRVDAAFGQPGKDLPGGVHKFSWPRTDSRVSIAGVPIEPPFALGSWGAFQMMDGGKGHAMGDLVLLGAEVAPVVRALEAGGFEILAIHNHLIDETPRVVYVHFHGKGDPATLARTLKDALARSATPLARRRGIASRETLAGAGEDVPARAGFGRPEGLDGGSRAADVHPPRGADPGLRHGSAGGDGHGDRGEFRNRRREGGDDGRLRSHRGRGQSRDSRAPRARDRGDGAPLPHVARDAEALLPSLLGRRLAGKIGAGVKAALAKVATK